MILFIATLSIFNLNAYASSSCEKLGNKVGPHEIIKKIDQNKYLAAVEVCQSKNSCGYQDALVIETTVSDFKNAGFIVSDFWVEKSNKKEVVKDAKGFDDSYAVVTESVPCAVSGMIEDYKQYAIAFAAKQGNLPVVKELVEKHGQNVNIADSSGVSVLDIAREKKQAAVVDYLLSKGAKGDNSHLVKEFVEAVQKKNLVKAKQVMKSGLDVNAKHTDSTTMLYVAAFSGDLEIVKYLVDHGAKVDATDNMKITPLIIASHLGHKTVVEYLISKGANINHVGDGKRTPTSVAQEAGHKEIVHIIKTARIKK